MSTAQLLNSLHSSKPVTGLTHNFYRYPACMSPELAREVISQFAQPGDFILDPFMGGGTTVVEALAAGRRAVGIDINPIAAFITAAKTSPLSAEDQLAIRRWVDGLDFSTNITAARAKVEDEPRARNLPFPAQQIFAYLLEQLWMLPFPRQQRFMRCALLRLGQWAIDCRNISRDELALKEKLLIYVDEMLARLNEFVSICQGQGIAKNKVTDWRTLLLRSVVDAQHDNELKEIVGKPKLVVTSPPYPGVHILYHRWQVAGRRETPAPYWLIDAQDGHGASYFTLGSRTKLGLKNYFQSIADAYRSIHAIIHPDALVIQLVSFSDVTGQLPAFLEAMQLAGYDEDAPILADHNELWRSVPRRQWYNRIDTGRGAGHELLLFHRPRPKV